METTRKTTKRKLHPTGLLAILLLILIVVLTAVLVLLKTPLLQTEQQLAVQPEDVVAGELVLPLAVTQAQQYYPFGTSLLLRVQNNRVEVLNLEGQVEYSFDGFYDQPLLRYVEGRLLLVDSQGFSYALLSSEGVIYSGQSQSPILGARLSPGGLVALVLESEGSKGVLRMLDATGNLLFDWTVQNEKESGYLLSAEFALDEKSVYVSLLNLSGAKPSPLINRFGLESHQLGQILAQYKPSSQEALPLLIPLTQSVYFVGSQEVVWQQEEAQTVVFQSNAISQAGYLGKEMYVLASRSQEESDGNVGLYVTEKEQFRTESQQLLPDVPREVQSVGNYLAVSLGDDVMLFSSLNLSKPTTFPLYGRLLRFQLGNRGELLCVCTDGVRRIAP